MTQADAARSARLLSQQGFDSLVTLSLARDEDLRRAKVSEAALPSLLLGIGGLAAVWDG